MTFIDRQIEKALDSEEIMETLSRGYLEIFTSTECKRLFESELDVGLCSLDVRKIRDGLLAL